MGKVSYSEKMLRYSNNNVSTLGDMLLLTTLLGTELIISGKPRTSIGARNRVEELKNFGKWSLRNHKQIKKTYYRLKRQGLIELIKEEAYTKPQITKQGQKRLEALLPSYESTRVWDGNLYIITYDINEKRRYDRDKLRKYLKKLGCAMMQQSVWITPYNPRKPLKDFIKSRKLVTSVIISDVATEEGLVGSETVPQLVERVYALESINERYVNFIEKASDKKAVLPKLFLEYNNILRSDPQLPFPLLPKYWQGDKAHETFLSLNNRLYKRKKCH